jgi:hypothetical protein
MALMGRKVEPQALLMARVGDRIQAMDEQGIDVEALSINPYWYKADRDVAREPIRIQNEKLAKACAANPDRFVAFASVALQHPDWPIRNSIRSGPRPSSSACWCSCTPRPTAPRPTSSPGSEAAQHRRKGSVDGTAVLGTPEGLPKKVTVDHPPVPASFSSSPWCGRGWLGRTHFESRSALGR